MTQHGYRLLPSSSPRLLLDHLLFLVTVAGSGPTVWEAPLRYLKDLRQ